MNENSTWPGGLDEPARYEIRVDGHVDAEWADWFDGLSVTMQKDGTTLLAGSVADQAALHGLLQRIGSLGMSLVSMKVVGPNDAK